MTEDWGAAYAALIRRLPSLAARARPIFCGNGACIDARVSLHEIEPMLTARLPEAVRFARFLQDRAARGQGGEVTYDWPAGPDWISAHVPVSHAMGGTGPHAAWTVSTLGAPAVLALQDRSALMLRAAPPEVLLAEGDGLVRAAAAQVAGTPRPPVFIFEFTAGRPVGAVTPARSSRIIVKFAHFGLEEDAAFERYTRAHAGAAGAGLVSGFSSVAAEDVPRETARVGSLAQGWRAGGLDTIHLELAGYDTPETLWTVLHGLRGIVTSVGMSLSELRAMKGDGDLRAALRNLAEEVEVDRVCIHADDWAASLTRRDPEVEREALLVGCLVAASRAAAGRPVVPDRIDPAVTFTPPDCGAGATKGPWTLVACASPFLKSPRTTLGLGDTFTGGCLLALSAAAADGKR